MYFSVALDTEYRYISDSYSVSHTVGQDNVKLSVSSTASTLVLDKKIFNQRQSLQHAIKREDRSRFYVLARHNLLTC